MSLINQMLQDLDKRGANPTSSDAVYAAPAALPFTSSRSNWQWILALLLVLSLGLAWMAWHQLRPLAKSAPAPLQPTATAVVSVAPLNSAPLRSAPKLPAQEMEAAVDELPAISDLPVLLKLSSQLDTRLVSQAHESESMAFTEKLNTQTVSAKSEKPSLTAKAMITPILTKPAEQAPSQPQIKLHKEATTLQQAEGEYRQATVLQQQGRTAEAVAMLEQALKIDGQHAAARQSLISLLLESKRYDEAMRYLQQGLAQDQNQTGLAMILARLQVEKSNLPAALATLQASLPYAGERADYLAFLAALLQREARHKESIDLYQKALKRSPQNPVWWMGLGISLQADGRRPEALEAYLRAKSLTGLSPDLVAFVEQRIAALQ
ncbi:tetratricopeptide repeat protein [Undibacterium parvum]|uniref:Tetratricopeptide repeat protein n=1 Tax=Undibacterium parvum TaxID=401471 RepID=A0A3Q9BPD3_9BURK|nr:tetratricopeptide repeat protein [Undibacterium parvum]AZP11496.1 tetratricopeptide repeat protein [Undibacterium parvum]